MRKSYPSDTTRGQFEFIRPLLERSKKTTHPRKYDLYDIFCAVLYLIKEGCTWRAIPHDFPKWENVRYHYDIWAKPDEDGFSLLDGILRDLVEIGRETDKREAQTTMLIIDSKSLFSILAAHGLHVIFPAISRCSALRNIQYFHGKTPCAAKNPLHNRTF